MPMDMVSTSATSNDRDFVAMQAYTGSVKLLPSQQTASIFHTKDEVSARSDNGQAERLMSETPFDGPESSLILGSKTDCRSASRLQAPNHSTTHQQE